MPPPLPAMPASPPHAPSPERQQGAGSPQECGSDHEPVAVARGASLLGLDPSPLLLPIEEPEKVADDAPSDPRCSAPRSDPSFDHLLRLLLAFNFVLSATFGAASGLGPSVADEFGLSWTQFAAMKMAKDAAYAALSIPAGRLLKAHKRVSIAAGFVVLAAGWALWSLSRGFATTVAAAAIVGAGRVPWVVLRIPLIDDECPDKALVPKYIGWFVVPDVLGTIAGYGIVALLVNDACAMTDQQCVYGGGATATAPALPAAPAAGGGGDGGCFTFARQGIGLFGWAAACGACGPVFALRTRRGRITSPYYFFRSPEIAPVEPPGGGGATQRGAAAASAALSPPFAPMAVGGRALRGAVEPLTLPGSTPASPTRDRAPRASAAARCVPAPLRAVAAAVCGDTRLALLFSAQLVGSLCMSGVHVFLPRLMEVRWGIAKSQQILFALPTVPLGVVASLLGGWLAARYRWRYRSLLASFAASWVGAAGVGALALGPEFAPVIAASYALIAATALIAPGITGMVMGMLPRQKEELMGLSVTTGAVASISGTFLLAAVIDAASCDAIANVVGAFTCGGCLAAAALVAGAAAVHVVGGYADRPAAAAAPPSPVAHLPPALPHIQ